MHTLCVPDLYRDTERSEARRYTPVIPGLEAEAGEASQSYIASPRPVKATQQNLVSTTTK